MDPATQATVAALGPVAQYGAVGIALVALGLIYLIVKQHSKDTKEIHDRTAEVIKQNTGALIENAKATSALAASLPNVCRYDGRK